MKTFAISQIISLIGFCLLSVEKVEGSFFDTVPIVSQIKFLVQSAQGDFQGALTTKNNFSRGNAIVGPVRAAVEFLHGDKKEALRTIKFVGENVEFFFAGFPILGHFIGLFLLLIGEKNRGVQAIKFASRNILVMMGGRIGFLFGGPFGSIAWGITGGFIGDVIITKLDSLGKLGNFKPFALVEGGAKIIAGIATTSEAFDFFALIGFDALAGYLSGRETEEDLQMMRMMEQMMMRNSTQQTQQNANNRKDALEQYLLYDSIPHPPVTTYAHPLYAEYHNENFNYYGYKTQQYFYRI